MKCYLSRRRWYTFAENSEERRSLIENLTYRNLIADNPSGKD
jgi:hypothetical protein